MLLNKGWVKILLVLSGAISLFLLLLLQLNVLKILIPLSVVAFLYVGKFPFKKLFSLRNVPFLKAHLVAGVWSGMAVLFPALQADLILSCDVWILYVAIYFFIFSLAIVFDIRDVDLDELDKRTIPQLMGVKPASFVAMSFSLISALLLIWLRNELVFSLLLFTGIAAVFFFFATKKRDDFYFSFWLDGLIILFSYTVILSLLFG